MTDLKDKHNEEIGHSEQTLSKDYINTQQEPVFCADTTYLKLPWKGKISNTGPQSCEWIITDDLSPERAKSKLPAL